MGIYFFIKNRTLSIFISLIECDTQSNFVKFYNKEEVNLMKLGAKIVVAILGIVLIIYGIFQIMKGLDMIG